jgi:hypothetical protein
MIFLKNNKYILSIIIILSSCNIKSKNIITRQDIEKRIDIEIKKKIASHKEDGWFFLISFFKIKQNDFFSITEVKYGEDLASEYYQLNKEYKVVYIFNDISFEKKYFNSNLKRKSKIFSFQNDNLEFCENYPSVFKILKKELIHIPYDENLIKFTTPNLIKLLKPPSRPYNE